MHIVFYFSGVCCSSLIVADASFRGDLIFIITPNDTIERRW